ncbi:84_t:CDS:1, partial [Funneliformis geosporum]
VRVQGVNRAIVAPRRRLVSTSIPPSVPPSTAVPSSLPPSSPFQYSNFTNLTTSQIHKFC